MPKTLGPAPRARCDLRKDAALTPKNSAPPPTSSFGEVQRDRSENGESIGPARLARKGWHNTNYCSTSKCLVLLDINCRHALIVAYVHGVEDPNHAPTQKIFQRRKERTIGDADDSNRGTQSVNLITIYLRRWCVSMSLSAFVSPYLPVPIAMSDPSASPTFTPPT